VEERGARFVVEEEQGLDPLLPRGLDPLPLRRGLDPSLGRRGPDPLPPRRKGWIRCHWSNPPPLRGQGQMCCHQGGGGGGGDRIHHHQGGEG